MINIDKALEQIRKNNEAYKELRYCKANSIEESWKLFIDEYISGKIKRPSKEELRKLL